MKGDSHSSSRWIQLPILECKLRSHIEDEKKVQEIMKWCELSSYSPKETVDNILNGMELKGYMDGLDANPSDFNEVNENE